MFKIKEDEHGGEGRENKPAYYEQTKEKASNSHARDVRVLLLSLVHVFLFFFPPTNQFKYYLGSQPKFLSVLQHTGTAREINSLSLKQAQSLLAFLFLASPVNHCVISVTQTPILQMPVCNGVLICRVLNAGVRETKALSFSGCQFPSSTTMEFFPPFAGRFAPSSARLAYTEQLLHEAVKSVHNHVLEL